tara:strand:- start:684 stop:1034 length:351 start_codon:yes stop_codon:yes gene_type:complete
MSAGTHNITIDQGATFELTVTIKESGSAKDLSSYSARAQLRKSKESSTSVVFTCDRDGAGSALSDTGVVTMGLTPAQTNSLTEGKYLYDLEIFTANDAIVNRIIQGSATVNRGITR